MDFITIVIWKQKSSQRTNLEKRPTTPDITTPDITTPDISGVDYKILLAYWRGSTYNYLCWRNQIFEFGVQQPTCSFLFNVLDKIDSKQVPPAILWRGPSILQIFIGTIGVGYKSGEKISGVQNVSFPDWPKEHT